MPSDPYGTVYPPMPPLPPDVPGTPGGQQLQEAMLRQALGAGMLGPAVQAAVPDAASARAAEERAKAAAAEQARWAQARTPQAAAARRAGRDRAAQATAAEARQEREHAKLVTAHELETNWAATRAYLDRLQVRVNRMPVSGSVRPAIAWIAIPGLFLAIVMALVAAAPLGTVNGPLPLAYVYFTVAVLFCWGAWALVRRARRAIRARHAEELRTLARSRDRGCGAARCRRCYRSS